jgi:hypothetical protein
MFILAMDLVQEKQNKTMRDQGWPGSTMTKGESKFYKIFRLLPAGGLTNISLL